MDKYEKAIRVAELTAKSRGGELPGAEAEEDLATLCDVEARRLRRRLKEPLREEDHSAFVCAVAWMAAADYFSGKSAALPASWQAGDVSVQEAGGAERQTAVENLRAAAMRILEDLLEDEGFVFLGVRG